MQPQLNKIQIVAHPDKVRADLEAARKTLASLQREYSAETDMNRKAQLQGAISQTSRQVQKLADSLGLANLPTQKSKASEARRKFVPTVNLTVEELLTLSAAGRVTPEGAAALVALRSMPGVQEVICPWVPPPFPKSPDAQSVAALMAACRTYTPVQPIMRCPKDPHFHKAGGFQNLLTNVTSPQYVGQDGEWIALLQQISSRFEAQRPAIKAALEEAVTGWYCGSGPLDGWFARIMAGDRRPHPRFQLTEAELAAVDAVLPWNKSMVPDFKQPLRELLKLIKVNGAAGAGFPRWYKKGVVGKEILGDCVQYFDLFSMSKLNEYMRMHPGEFVTQAKAKLDRYEQDDWGKKIRPYYNANGGLAMLYSVVSQAYSNTLVGFWQDPRSCNAHGFAWNSGGGDRLYSWVKWASKQPPGIYAIGYSDDGIWVLVGENGSVIVSDRDVAQMDASCGSSFLPVYRGHSHNVLGETGPWKNIVNAQTAAVFQQVICLYKSLCYVSKDKIHSGLPGTAEADQVCFAVLYVLLRAAYKALGTERSPVQRFDAALEEVTRRIGLTFKPTEWHVFQEGQEAYPWAFLGKTLRRFRGHYLPHVSLEKAVVQLAVPKKNEKGLAGQRAWMERARGLAVTSLFAHEPLYEMAKAEYTRKRKLNVTPAATMDGEDVGEEDLLSIMGQGIALRFTTDDFPTRAWIYNFYLGLTEVAEEAGAGAAVPALVPVRSAADAFGELFADELIEDARVAKDWADTPVPNPTLDTIKRGLEAGEGQRIQALDVHPVPAGPAQYTVAPLPDEVKRAFNDARRDALSRFAKNYENRRGQLLRGGRMEAVLTRPEDSFLVFTKDGIKQVWDSAAELDSWTAGLEQEVDEAWAQYYEPEATDAELDAQLTDRYDRQVDAAYARSRR